jgi:hypothetical protein
MDWLQFFSSVIESLAWPAAVITLAVLMRGQLAQLIEGIRSFEWDKLKITIGERLHQVSEKLENVPEAPPPIQGESRHLAELAELDPRAAIMAAWASVESEVLKLMSKVGITPSKVFTKNANALYAQGLLDQTTMQNLASLRSVRNDAAHAPDREIHTYEAMIMVDTCNKIVAQLQETGEQL